MPLPRRKFLALAGGGAILAAGSGAGAFVTTRTPRDALRPWSLAGQYGEIRRDALSYALLAPNPHNRQPWIVRLDGADGVTVWRDPQRDLPVTDPYGRQLTIGMGCFMELMAMAAAEGGYGVERRLFPDGEAGPVAVCRFVPGAAAPDPLFAHAMARRSHKEGFADTPVTAEAAAPLAPHARILTDGPDRDALRRLIHDAWLAEMATPAAYNESIDLLRIGKAEINARPDGIDAGGPMLEALALAGLFTHEAARDPDNPGSRAVIEETAAAIRAAPALVLQTTPANSRTDQIDAGAAWLRLNLAATGAGLALRPVSQALQEYAEVAPMRREVHDRFAPEGGTVQMAGLLGYGPAVPRTPRWRLETRMIG